MATEGASTASTDSWGCRLREKGHHPILTHAFVAPCPYYCLTTTRLLGRGSHARMKEVRSAGLP